MYLLEDINQAYCDALCKKKYVVIRNTGTEENPYWVSWLSYNNIELAKEIAKEFGGIVVETKDIKAKYEL